MKGSRISALGSALADPTRATALAALLSGTAHTSGELARVARVAPSTMSGHLGKLVDAGLVHVEAAGRHRHYRIASAELAQWLEQMDAMELPEVDAPPRPKPGADLALARSCYDHVAGQLGVAMYDAFLEHEWVVLDGQNPVLTSAGERLLVDDLGLDLDPLRRARRPLLRLDVDWTERRNHLAGSIPAAMMGDFLRRKWLRRGRDKRVLKLTEPGRRNFDDVLGVRLSP